MQFSFFVEISRMLRRELKWDGDVPNVSSYLVEIFCMPLNFFDPLGNLLKIFLDADLVTKCLNSRALFRTSTLKIDKNYAIFLWYRWIFRYHFQNRMEGGLVYSPPRSLCNRNINAQNASEKRNKWSSWMYLYLTLDPAWCSFTKCFQCQLL